MMDQPVGLRPPSDPSRRPAPASRLVRALYTHNPFYVISADLIFIGLRMSFDPSVKDFDTWALISSLAGYTLLLATTACLLVRFGKVWDDMRSVLLLVVMMFLAISATIDDVLILRPGVGISLAIGGLAFALLVSEGLLRGMRLGMPALYRGPYYLILSLFFLYPVALRPLLASPDSPLSCWSLFGFSTAAGLAFLTLLPAIRRGSGYVKGNGSPWRWPLYPWSLFFFLGLGVCARSYYLCISLHNVEGYRSIFGPYFLVPFGFAVALLLLEAGLVSGKKECLAVRADDAGVLAGPGDGGASVGRGLSSVPDDLSRWDGSRTRGGDPAVGDGLLRVRCLSIGGPGRGVRDGLAGRALGRRAFDDGPRKPGLAEGLAALAGGDLSRLAGRPPARFVASLRGLGLAGGLNGELARRSLFGRTERHDHASPGDGRPAGDRRDLRRRAGAIPPIRGRDAPIGRSAGGLGGRTSPLLGNPARPDPGSTRLFWPRSPWATACWSEAGRSSRPPG